MRVWVLCDDPRADQLRPLTWLRPASDLRLGAETLHERWKRLTDPEPVVVVTRDLLAEIVRGRIAWSRLSFHLAQGTLLDGVRVADAGIEAAPAEITIPAANDSADVSGRAEADLDLIWVSDLFVPDRDSIRALSELSPGQPAYCNDRLAAWRGRTSAQVASATDLLDWRSRPNSSAARVPGDCLADLGDLIRLQAKLLDADLARIVEQSPTAPAIGDGVAYAPESIRIGANCAIDHGAVLDAREGPIVLSAGSHVYPHTWIRGPFHAAPGCHFLGGRIGSGSSFGPECRIRGEVEATVFLGYDNKAHDGFIGHSYIGEWVNLGALTTTSDLKNNYGNVALQIGELRVATGQRKIGSFLGDHVKTRIGCLLDTGTTVGVGANLFGEPAVPGKWVPSFAWGTGAESSEYALGKFLETVRVVLSRRGVPSTEVLEAVLRDVHHQTAAERNPRSGSASADPVGSTVSSPPPVSKSKNEHPLEGSAHA